MTRTGKIFVAFAIAAAVTGAAAAPAVADSHITGSQATAEGYVIQDGHISSSGDPAPEDSHLS